MQLQSFCSQIQNIAYQLTNINPILGTQMQNVGFQISNLATQIFNIGIQISNMLNNIQNFGNMPYNMNNINLENNNEFLKNDIINNDIDIINKNNNINILFVKNEKGIANIYISKEKSLKDLIDSFLTKAGLNPDFLNKNWFLFNATRIFPDDKIKIKDLNFNDPSRINIYEKNIMNKEINSN